MPRTPPKNVVVITGASSPIGQALALEFALRGDAVVLAAPSEELLEETKRTCGMLGAWTMGKVVPDRDDRAVRQLAKETAERFGRIDIWINHVAPYVRVDNDDEANGGALAAEMALFEAGGQTALKVFEIQKRGVLVNIDGYFTMPEVSGTARTAVRQLFSSLSSSASSLPGVISHTIVAATGVAVSDLARRVAELARASARGDAVGRATALLTMQQLKLWTNARKARRKLERDHSAHTVVMEGAVRASKSDERDENRRRGGWHLAYARDTNQTSALAVLIALPLLMAAVMLVLVRG